MAVVDRLILGWRFTNSRASDTPPKVVINEAVELRPPVQHGRAPRFVNGVLDGIRKKLEEKC